MHLSIRIAATGLIVIAATAGVRYGQTAAATPPYLDHTRLLVFRDGQGAERPVTTIAEWAVRRTHVLTAMHRVMGPLPGDEKRCAIDPRILEEVVTERYVRKKMTIAAEPGDRLPLYLFVPKARSAKAPAVVCLHPTNRALGKGVVAGMGEKTDLHYAIHLAERGYVTVAPDYVNMGEYSFDPYAHGYASATMKGVWNHMRCIDLLRSLAEVDGDRIAAIGHSLGGHNSMFLAVFDDRVKCVVSSCGFCSFPRYMKGDLTGWSHDGYMPRIRTLYGRDPARVPFDFTEVVGALAPRPFLACAPIRDTNFDVQGVKDCIIAAQPVYKLLGAEERLRAAHPDTGHDFPQQARDAAYDWLDRWLKPQ